MFQCSLMRWLRCPNMMRTSKMEVPRPIVLMLQFLEICGGAGKATACLVKRGAVCRPVLDLSISEHYNIANHRVLSWVAFMLEQDTLLSFLVAPPCTAFSPAARPSLRTYKRPRGIAQRAPECCWPHPCLCSPVLALCGTADEFGREPSSKQDALARGVAEAIAPGGYRGLPCQSSTWKRLVQAL